MYDWDRYINEFKLVQAYNAFDLVSFLISYFPIHIVSSLKVKDRDVLCYAYKTLKK